MGVRIKSIIIPDFWTETIVSILLEVNGPIYSTLRLL